MTDRRANFRLEIKICEDDFSYLQYLDSYIDLVLYPDARTLTRGLDTTKLVTLLPHSVDTQQIVNGVPDRAPITRAWYFPIVIKGSFKGGL